MFDGRKARRFCGLQDFRRRCGARRLMIWSPLEDARAMFRQSCARPAIAFVILIAFPDIDPDWFYAAYVILGAQRNAKIVGILPGFPAAITSTWLFCRTLPAPGGLLGDLSPGVNVYSHLRFTSQSQPHRFPPCRSCHDHPAEG